jgi:hypothetical protein
MTVLLRYQLFLGIGVTFLSIWYAMLSSQLEADVLVKFAPVWFIAALGLYAFISIAYGVISCKDFPEAAHEIEIQVQEAKAEMKKRGIITDDQVL